MCSDMIYIYVNIIQMSLKLGLEFNDVTSSS